MGQSLESLRDLPGRMRLAEQTLKKTTPNVRCSENLVELDQAKLLQALEICHELSRSLPLSRQYITVESIPTYA